MACLFPGSRSGKIRRAFIMLQGILLDAPATSKRRWRGRSVLAINSARFGNPERAIYHITSYGY
ncbi:hypothetical protein GGR53DRAFT_507165 [Hypoxylon sp. FL1150]|nr:hypothetical protein GGR53DRAFT_507165 [Hypoxylon sp. FL1150]